MKIRRQRWFRVRMEDDLAERALLKIKACDDADKNCGQHRHPVMMNRSVTCRRKGKHQYNRHQNCGNQHPCAPLPKATTSRADEGTPNHRSYCGTERNLRV